jgi:glycosyltransferase involved in cell wall biosynthesis
VKRLAVIPSDHLGAYKNAGIESWLEEYYNPRHFFDEVFLLSPLEKEQRFEFGMHIIPTKPKQLKNRIKELNIDIVRAYGGYWTCKMACKNKVEGVPVVVSVHETNPNKIDGTIKKADIVLCVSEAVKKLVLTKYNPLERIWLLPNRVNFDIMRPYKRFELEDLYSKYPPFKYHIVHVGRKTRQKNLDTLIKSLKLLGNEYCMIAIGVGDKAEYERLAKNEGVIKQCYFLESIKNHELARYYSFGDCMCTPSRSEGFGIVFIEALACESIVVTSDIAPMNEFIKNDYNGILVKKYEDPEEVAKAIKKACMNTHIKEIIRANSRNSVSKFEKKEIDNLEVSYYKKIMFMKSDQRFKRPGIVEQLLQNVKRF